LLACQGLGQEGAPLLACQGLGPVSGRLFSKRGP